MAIEFFKMRKIKIPKFLKSVRYSLVAVNSLFVITGLVLLIAGAVILSRHHIYSQLITQRFFTLPGFAIGTGVIILLTSILGFYAAISEHFYFIIGYLLLLLAVLIFEIAITVTGYELRSGTSLEIRSTMLQSLQLYETRIEVAKLWDNMQMENAHNTGCASALGEWLSQNVFVIAVVALVVTVIQIVLTSLAGWLAWRSKFEEVELER